MTNNNSFHIYAVSIIMSAFSLVCPSSIFAVERNDSSTTENKEQNVKELKEVVVEGESQWLSARKSAYIPTSRQKKAAQDASDLLMRMAIPELHINPIDRIIKTVTGDLASVFIDFVPARQEDLAGLKTTDVKRVDFYTVSDDPRFGGALNVVNFILYKYEVGGYTKLSGELDTKRFDGTSLYNAENLYSKFSYKAMTYDLYAGMTNVRNKRAGDVSGYTYRIPGKGGSVSEYSKETLRTDHKYFSNSFPVTFRAVYNTPKFMFQTHAGYTYDFMPALNAAGLQTIVHDGTRSDGGYSSVSNGKKHNFIWRANATAGLPSGFSLNLNCGLKVFHGNIHRLYSTTDNLRLDNSYTENNVSPNISLRITKEFGTGHSLDLGCTYSFRHNSVKYAEAAPSDFSLNYLGSSLGYDFFSDKWTVYASAGLEYENNLVGGVRNTYCLPHLQTHMTFSPDSKNRIMLQARYGTFNPALNSNSNTILRTSEFMYVTGNPEIKSTNFADLMLKYTFLPAAWLRGSVYAVGNMLFNSPVTLYSPYDSPDGSPSLLRYVANDGTFSEFKAGANLSSFLFRNTFSISLNPEYRYCRRMGALPFSFNSFQMGISANWYIGDFYVTAYGWLPTVQMSQNGTETRQKGYYSLSGGWSNGNVQLSLDIANFADWSWDGDRTSYFSTYYDSYSQSFTSGVRHASFRLKVAWTIGYGKKVRRGNEIGAQKGSDSGAL